MTIKTHKTLDAPTEAPLQQQQPTPGPTKKEIELKTNDAYGPVRQLDFNRSTLS